ncbi:MAG: putative fimbrial protein [Phycisphaerales bacterium]|nr:putative fimbrial protein [Phycisphaerales bacterium]
MMPAEILTESIRPVIGARGVVETLSPPLKSLLVWSDPTEMALSRKLVGRGVFSLMELAVVVVSLGVVAAIVGPRMSRGAVASPQQGDQVLVGRLRLLRGALDDYASEHGGRYPAGDAGRVVRQLTEYTDRAGETSPTRTAELRLGPYLREIPALPVGGRRGVALLAIVGGSDVSAGGWIYNPATGQIRANTEEGECDGIGRAYSAY